MTNKKNKAKSAAARRAQQAEAQAKRGQLQRAGTGPRPTIDVVAAEPEATPPRAQAQEPASHDYVDVAAVRIQDWLERSPILKFRRGASVWLSKATAGLTLPADPDGSTVELNPEAGSIDGVVSIRRPVPPASPRTTGPDAASSSPKRW